MIGAIPNPKKSFHIERPIAIVLESIEYIPFLTTDYKLTRLNPTLNQITFEASELLSFGVYIDINYMSVNETRTQVEIEIRRKVGSFDKSYEVTLANNHIVNISDLLARSIESDPTVRKAKVEDYIQRINAASREAKEVLERIAYEKSSNPTGYYSKKMFSVLLKVFLAATLFGLLCILFWPRK
ncbi:MAG TPA: hypothetical protein VK590_14260 [Saprospiraceae bacterium]|nr:hypothetical protein [Saprospiraceae bacterium]